MKVPLWLLCINAVLSHHHHHRLELDMDLFFKEHRTVYRHVSHPNQSGKPQLMAKLTNGNPIQIDYSCEVQNKTLCDYAERGFENAAARIASEIHIAVPIRIMAKYRSFCNQVPNCDMQEMVGGAKPTAWFAAKLQDESKGQLYNYPQALLKQLSQQGSDPNYNAHDIVADFNADYSFYFRVSQNAGINNLEF